MNKIVESPDTIAEGDVVILYTGFRQTCATTVLRSRTNQTKFGVLRHDDLIGKRYGSKVTCSKGYVYALRPTPEMWTKNLLKRTQVLYMMDTSTIVLNLDLKPGCVVVEAGCGSGSLSHVILRTIAPNGKLFTFDVNAERVENIGRDFAKNGFDQLAAVERRNVCEEGFGLTDVADALFLDLPSPWQVIGEVRSVLKGGKACRFGSFSPCIEQVQKTCEALRRERFVDIDVVECIIRHYRVSSVSLLNPRARTSPDRDVEPVARKRARTELPPDAPTDQKGAPDKTTAGVVQQWQQPNPPCVPSVLTFTAEPPEQPSHTGYLTFATALPRTVTIDQQTTTSVAVAGDEFGSENHETSDAS